MRTVPVQLKCRKCGHHFRTTVRNGNTRCPSCRGSRYVRLDQEWEGPVTAALSQAATRAESVAARTPVDVRCGCGHVWQSRAKDRMTLHCPACRTGVRVPARTDEWSGWEPPPPPARRSPAPARRSTPAPASWQAPPVPRAGFLSRLFAAAPAPPTAPARRPTAAPATRARPASASRPMAPAPRPAAAPAARRSPVAPGTRYPNLAPEQDKRRRDLACALTSGCGGPLLMWYDSPIGTCEVLDTQKRREDQRCPVPPDRIVVYSGTASPSWTYACAHHALQLELSVRHALIYGTVSVQSFG